MMQADPDFNPNIQEHRILSLEAMDRTSSTLLKMNGINIASGIKIDMPVLTEESGEGEPIGDTFPFEEPDQDDSDRSTPSGSGQMPG